MDWTRIIQLGFASEHVKDLILKEYTEVVENRNSFVTDQLNKIGKTEAGLLIGSIQNFKIPQEMEVFNIMPPEHDRIIRWLTEKEKSLNSTESPKDSEENTTQKDSSDKEGGLWTP